MALPAERLVQDRPNGAVVVGDENGGAGAHGVAWGN
jgi:hypothetical protein